MPRYDARQALENIDRLMEGRRPNTLPPPSLDAPGPAATSPPSGPSDKSDRSDLSDSSDLTDSSARSSATWDALSLTILPALREHQQVDKVRPGSRFSLFKKLWMRALRMISGPQAAHNYHVRAGLEVVATHIDGLRRQSEEDTRRKTAELRSLRQSFEAAAAESLAEQKRQRTVMEDTAARLDGALSRIQSLEGVAAELLRVRDEFQLRLVEYYDTMDQMEARVREALRAAEEQIGGQMTTLGGRIHEVYLSNEDQIQAIWRGLGERDQQAQRNVAGIQACHSQVAAIEKEVRDARAQLLVLGERIRRLAERAATPPRPSHLSDQSDKSDRSDLSDRPGASSPASAEAAQDLDLMYLEFQRKFRGDENMLRERQKGYVDLLARWLEPKRSAVGGEEARLRLLDLACGDGIFLELWRGRPGWEVEGVDINAAMVDIARRAALPVRRADAFAELESGPPARWDAITSFQFVEHLEEEQLARLMRGLRRALRPGGLVLLETLNPHTLLAHKWFHLDLSHKHLIFPEMLGLMAETAGFRVLEHRAVSEPAEHERLRLATDAVSNENIRRLNDFLFGAQDYYMLAQAPED